ncbi:poly(ADP-ribose) glycohydrolase ARH3-like isoform X2 [Mizuhopecten yessoensis]|uniref:poly(ADP-ribose) glycohydrolase ARH3-like isoform X2 n=1 Tax=Mizuhopecten yessoensis TaxID=6573 RepID=UPI000B458AC1|nr:poly(ADP-ribose) glycohydrolase ARH3-like isoform X2 [Mizuhopecten yessoensis]
MAQACSLLSRFRGCLAGAVIGDCVGDKFESKWADSIAMVRIIHEDKKIREAEKRKKANENADGEISNGEIWTFTDDTAMARSVARSLIEHKGFNARDMARRFTEEYFNERFRGYGGSVTVVFQKLQETEYENPFEPAKKQFEGEGSYGNGGAMRIAPAGLFGYKDNDFHRLRDLAEDITKITHSHYQAIQGAVLQAYAVDLALRVEGHLDADEFLNDLIKQMKLLEQEAERITIYYERRNEKTITRDSGEERSTASEHPYCDKLEKIKTFLKQEAPPSPQEINEELGTDVAALESVPAAIFAFLYATKDIPYLENRNLFEKTVMYAISLGGDTDTIATMAAAIAGACYGEEQLPEHWKLCCEGVDDALEDAEQLYNLSQSSNTQPPGSDTKFKIYERGSLN